MEFRHRPPPSSNDGKIVERSRGSDRVPFTLRFAIRVRSLLRLASIVLLLNFSSYTIPSLQDLASPFSTALVGKAFGADIAFPIVEPRLPIQVTGKFGSHQRRGDYDVFEIIGDGRVEQGDFSATSQRIQIWVEKTSLEKTSINESTTNSDLSLLSPSQKRNDKSYDSKAGANSQAVTQSFYKTIIKCSDNVSVNWNNKDQLKDREWMGRIFSYSMPNVDVSNWTEPVKDLPTLAWESQDRNGFEGVSPAQFSQIQTPQFAGEQLPVPPSYQPQSLQPQAIEIPRPEIIAPERSGSVQSSIPLGGLVIEGDIPPGVGTSDSTTLFQVPTGDVIPRTQVPLDSLGNRITPVVSDPPNKIGAKTFEFSGRGGIDPQLETIPSTGTNESVVAISRGIRLKFGGATVQSNTGPVDLGTVLIEADRALIWTGDFQRLLTNRVEGTPIEVYLEGNVVFQQGQRTIYADRMYYNVQNETGMVLGAEILTPAPQYEGIVRLKADVIEQQSRQSFLAYNAAMTSSRLGVPSYWLQAERLSLQDTRAESNRLQSAAALRTGQTNMEASSRNNFVYFQGVPVLYWPILNTNIDAPNFYLRGGKIKNDQIFGQQIMLDFDLYNLLGVDGPDGTDWSLSTDYLSKRGFALGTTLRYNVPNTFLPGPATGFLDIWGLNDRGNDFLGADRANLVPERDIRGRLVFRHRQQLTSDWELSAEVGLISDRNFLEQYFERDWDQEKDYTTNLRLRRYAGNQLIDIMGQPRLNRFVTETEFLPKIEHYILGQSIFDRLTWYAQSQVAYAHLRTASTPINAAEIAKFQLQPWEVDSEGIRAGTRQELALPLELGPMKLVPFLNGEIMTWGEDVTGNSLTRATGQLGVRSTIPFWKVYPEVQNRIFNVNGIAHKAAFNTEFFYADTNKNISQLPLYDPLDDNSQEAFRRRLIFNTFGGNLPAQFDSRSYAIRQGMQRYVTASSKEVVEDQMQFRLGLDQRWQTKRGVPGRERITDLVEFDIDGILFPKASRDNFGQTVGALNYDARFHIGDRVSLLSDGYADVFDQGLKIVSGGAMITRPGRGDWYVGLTSLRGPINTLVANSNITYRLNDKWLFAGGTTFDFREVGNVGQSLSVTRIGEAFLTQVGLTVDSGRSNTSLFFNIEPRFIPLRRLGNVGGQAIPPAGLYGLE